MVNPSGFLWDVTPNQAFEPLFDTHTRRIRAAAKGICQFFAPQVEAWMKQNASWTDQTGNLRQSLYAEVETMVNEIALSFDYGLEYGVYIAFKNSGKYDIIGPAIDHFAPLVMQMVREVLEA